MKVLEVLSDCAGPFHPLGALATKVQEVGFPGKEPLSVYLEKGVVRRDEVTDNHNVLGADLARYQRVLPGDLVFNRLRTWQGGFGASPYEGIVSPAYIVLRPHQVHARYLDHVLHSRPYLTELTRLSKWMPPSQFDILWADLKGVRVPTPSVDEQRRIADFLDDRVARIDRIIAARRTQAADFSELLIKHSLDTVTGAAIAGDRRPSSLDWLGLLPSAWPVVPVATQFQVDLGKMLDEKRRTGSASIPYLRNTNVQWDRTDISDLKEMDIDLDERSRYTVRPGDLLVCEGGQPGRAAIWDGGVADMGFQKALHRVRTRGRSLPQWLLECLRVAVHMKVFIVESGQTTIAHLTNEQLRGQRFPFPEPSVQRRLLDELEQQRRDIDVVVNGIQGSIDLLTEYKSSLITAAVTGELDVTTASRRIPGE